METAGKKIPKQQVNPAQAHYPNESIQNLAPAFPITNQRKTAFLIGFIVLLILFSEGAYYLGTQQNKSTPPITQTTQTTPNPAVTTELSPTITATNPASVANITWKTQTIPLQHESAFVGKQTVTMELKIPNEWTLQTYPRQADSNNMIKNCSDYVITSPIVGLSMMLSPICSGWSAKYSNWPTDAVIVLQQKREGNDGQHNYYRIRYATTTDNYNYVDSITDPDHPLDKNKDQVMDTILIGYAPPNENTNDFFFIAAHLTSTYYPAAGEKDKYLSIADQIAASITLR